MRHPHMFYTEVTLLLTDEFPDAMIAQDESAETFDKLEEVLSYGRFLMKDGAFYMAAQHLRRKASADKFGCYGEAEEKLRLRLERVADHLQGHAAWCAAQLGQDAVDHFVLEVLKEPGVCISEEDHEWVTEPNSHGLIDVCIICGAGRA